MDKRSVIKARALNKCFLKKKAFQSMLLKKLIALLFSDILKNTAF